MRKQTLHPQSIAMENPLYIPESSSTPSHISIPNEEVGDEGFNNILSTHRAHVPCGQRHALLTYRNTKFERRIGSNTKASNNDGDYKIEDRVDVNTPLPQSLVTNNGNAGASLSY